MGSFQIIAKGENSLLNGKNVSWQNFSIFRCGIKGLLRKIIQFSDYRFISSIFQLLNHLSLNYALSQFLSNMIWKLIKKGSVWKCRTLHRSCCSIFLYGLTSDVQLSILGLLPVQMHGRLHRQRQELPRHKRVQDEQRRLRSERSVHQQRRFLQMRMRRRLQGRRVLVRRHRRVFERSEPVRKRAMHQFRRLVPMRMRDGVHAPRGGQRQVMRW